MAKTTSDKNFLDNLWMSLRNTYCKALITVCFFEEIRNMKLSCSTFVKININGARQKNYTQNFEISLVEK